MNRSNHMPMFARIETMNTAIRLCRTFLNQKSCGTIALNISIAHPPYQYCPNNRCQNVQRSYGLPLYQAMKYSIA